MAKKAAPLSPGAKVKGLIDEYYLSIDTVAVDLGLSPSFIRLIVNGKRKLSPDLAIRLAKYFGGTAEEWYGIQVSCDLDEARQDKQLLEAVKVIKKAKKGTPPKKEVVKEAKQAAGKKAPAAKKADAVKKGPATGAKRGRKPKAATADTTAPASAPKKRGRKPKSAIEAPVMNG
jgi:addiction module HigA family antidote